MEKEKEIIKTEEEKKEETKQNTDALSYQGQVKVSIQKDKKILSSKKYHNSGKANLFKFICNCLAGNYDGNTRPCKIALFTAGDGEAFDAKDDIAFKKDNLRTPAILTDTTAVIDPIKDTTGTITHYTITYHFRIPYSYISGNSIYKAALFSVNPNLDTDIINSLYATYRFANQEMTVYDPIIIDTAAQGNFSIIVEWTMSIKNTDGQIN